MPPKILKYVDNCVIDTLDPSIIHIETPNESLSFDELEERRVFQNDRGESVIEYTGLSSDGHASRSYAKAMYEPGGSSVMHYHDEHTENYYIIEGVAKVMLDGVALELQMGDCVTLPVGSHHQVLNITPQDGALVLIVQCVPSWTVDDFNLVEPRPTLRP